MSPLFPTVIAVVRCLDAGVGASFAALLVRASLPVWHRLGAVEKWLAVTLFVYSANVSIFCALFWTSPASARSLINLGFLVSLLAGLRYLYFIRRDTHGR